MNLLGQLVVNTFVTASLLSVLACAFGIIYRVIKVFHIAFGALFVATAYVFAMIAEMSIVLAGLSAIIAGGLLGWMTEVAFYRPMLKIRTTAGAAMVASLGLYVVIENSLALVLGSDVVSVVRSSASLYRVGHFSATSIQLVTLGVCAVSLVVFALLKSKWSTFKAIWTMGDEAELLAIFGHPTHRYRAFALAIGTAMSAIPACIFAYDFGVTPQAGLTHLLSAAVAVLVGGLDRVSGWIMASCVIAGTQNIAILWLSSEWIEFATFVVMILVLIFRPNGLFGLERRLEEKHA